MGVSEARTFKDTEISDSKWYWDPGQEKMPNPKTHRGYTKTGALYMRGVRCTLLTEELFSTWYRMETEEGPLFIGVVYFPHSSDSVTRLLPDRR